MFSLIIETDDNINSLCLFSPGVAVASSVFTIMILSVDRYLAIRHPMTFRIICASQHAWKIITSIWILSFLIMIPMILVRKLELLDLMQNQTLYFCTENWALPLHRQVYDGLLVVFMFIMPGCFVAASYCRIGCQLWRDKDVLYRTDSAHGKRQAERVMSGRRKVARILIIVAVLFAVCWMPYHVLALYIDFQNSTKEVSLNALPFTILLGHSNSALNPVLYCFMNKSFRRCTLTLFRCKSRQKPKGITPVSIIIYSFKSTKIIEIYNHSVMYFVFTVLPFFYEINLHTVNKC